jgi:virulence factor Mce-like protein
MTRRRPRSRLAIGIAGILAVVVIVYGVFAKHIPFVHGYRIKGDFASSNQLIANSPVRIAGVNVGRVVSIGKGPGNTTEVTMEISDAGRPIHRDATLRIRPRLFLEGGFSVELRPGSPSAPELPDGGTIPRAQTAIPVQFHQVLSALDRPTRESFQSLVGQLDAALGRGGARAIGQTAKPLAPVLRDTAQIAEAARGVRPHDAATIIASGSRVTGALASRRDDLAGLVVALHRTTATLASRDAQLRATVRELDGLLQAAPPALSAVDRALPPTQRFVALLRPSLRAAPPVLDATRGVLDQLGGLVSRRELPAVVADLAPSVGNLPRLEQRLETLFGILTPVIECVRTRALPVLVAQAPDANLSSGRPIWQDLVHSFIGLADASQNFDGNGFAIRYLAGGGEQTFSTGEIPNVGTLTGLADSTILGARPQWLGPGVAPPYRPDQPCLDQPVVDLSQRTGVTTTPGRMGRAGPRAPLTPQRLRTLEASIARALRRRNG